MRRAAVWRGQLSNSCRGASARVEIKGRNLWASDCEYNVYFLIRNEVFAGGLVMDIVVCDSSTSWYKIRFFGWRQRSNESAE